jgi:hypothetical protein
MQGDPEQPVLALDALLLSAGQCYAWVNQHAQLFLYLEYADKAANGR